MNRFSVRTQVAARDAAVAGAVGGEVAANDCASRVGLKIIRVAEHRRAAH